MQNLPTKNSETGAWEYPATWDDAAKASWVAMQQALEAARAEAASLDAVADAPPTPADAMAALRAEIDETRRETERKKRTRDGEAAWKKAVETHGDRVAFYDTKEGDRIVMLAMTDKEVDASVKRSRMLADQARKNAKSAASADAESDSAWAAGQRDAMIAKIQHPDRDRVKALCARYPLLWGKLMMMRDALIDCERTEQGKDSAL